MCPLKLFSILFNITPSCPSQTREGDSGEEKGVEGKYVIRQRGNYCRVLLLDALTNQSQLKTLTGLSILLFIHQQTPEGRDVTPFKVISSSSSNHYLKCDKRTYNANISEHVSMK